VCSQKKHNYFHPKKGPCEKSTAVTRSTGLIDRKGSVEEDVRKKCLWKNFNKSCNLLPDRWQSASAYHSALLRKKSRFCNAQRGPNVVFLSTEKDILDRWREHFKYLLNPRVQSVMKFYLRMRWNSGCDDSLFKEGIFWLICVRQTAGYLEEHRRLASWGNHPHTQEGIWRNALTTGTIPPQPSWPVASLRGAVRPWRHYGLCCRP